MNFDPSLSRSDQTIIQEEVELLQKVQSVLAKENSELLNQTDYYQDILELRQLIAESKEEDAPMLTASMERLLVLQKKQEEQKANKINPNSPYFGHIKIEEENSTEREILIGTASMISPDLPCVIVDWKKAPISMLFYRYCEDDEFSERIGDRVMEGLLTLKRTLRIKGGELASIQLESHTLVKENGVWRLSVKNHGLNFTTRPNEQKVSTEKYLPEITALIDTKQFDAMTRPSSGVVELQGGAGSGKTTIALHRIAYLIAQNPERFQPKKIAVFVFNKAIQRYIARLLPNIGVQDVQIWIYTEWIQKILLRCFPKIPQTFAEDTPLAAVEIKRHELWVKAFEESIVKQTAHFETCLEKVLESLAESDKKRAWNVWKKLETEPIATRLVKFSMWSLDQEKIYRVAPCQNDWLRQRIPTLVENEFPGILDDKRAFAIMVWDDCFLYQDNLKAILNRHAPDHFSDSKIEQTWSRHTSLYQLRQETQEVEDSTWEEEIKKNIISQPAELDEEDATLLLLLYQMTIGKILGKNKKPMVFSHLTVDEVQDFSALELKLLFSVISQKEQSITLAGDFDQQIVFGSSIKERQTLHKFLGMTNVSTEALEIGYRSTEQIINVSKKVLGPHSVNQKWKAVRRGDPVEFLSFHSTGEMIDFLARAVTQFLRKRPHSNLAILTRFSDQADVIYDGLLHAEVNNISRIRDQEFSFSAGVEISEIHQTKGLEFDYVILANCDAATFPDTLTARRLLHVGITRAAHQLWLVADKEPVSPLLPHELLETNR